MSNFVFDAMLFNSIACEKKVYGFTLRCLECKRAICYHVLVDMYSKLTFLTLESHAAKK
jgi:hypothetical protein